MILRGTELRNHNLKSNGIIILITMVFFILFLTVLMLQQVKFETIDNLEDSMISVLQTTDESLKLWIGEQIQRLDYDIQDTYFRTVLQELILHEKNRVLYRVEMSRYLREKKNHLLSKPYYVVSKDFEVLASNLEGAIGTVLPLKRELEKLDNIDLTFETSFVPPFKIEEPDGSIKHVLYYISPVFNSENQWIGFFMLEENPGDNFTRLCEIGRFDQTGETYAFNKQGYLLSNSRFKTESEGILSARIRNFGLSEDDGQWFDYTLQQMLSEEINSNMNGYKDYRNIEVFGVWIWNNELNFGLTTEIDVADALSSYYNYRNNVVIIVVIALIISAFSIVYTIITSLRHTDYLKEMNLELESKVIERTKALTNANTVFDSAINALTHPFYVIDASNYEIIVANEAFKKDLGKSRTYCYSAIHDKTSPCDGEQYSCPLKRVLQERDSVIMNHIHHNAKGEDILVELHAYPIFDDDDRIVQVIGYYEDITERIVAEMETTKALDRVEKLYQASVSLSQSLNLESVLGNILEHLRDVVPFESASIQKYENELFKILYCTGFSEPELVTGKEFEAIPGTINHTILTTREPMIINDLTDYEEFKDLTKDKKISSWMGIPLVYQGEVIGELTLDSSSKDFYTKEMADLGEAFATQAAIALHNANIVEELNRAREIAEKATKAKSDFLANMSHEIRTPMNAIIGFGDLLSRTEMNKKQTDYLDKIIKSSKNLLGIINDILDFSKIEAGKLDLEEIPFNLEETLSDMSDVVSLKAYTKGIEFTIFKEKKVPQTLLGDPQRLYQILLNLTNNAIKFTDNGEVVLRISVFDESDDSLQLKFEVEDTGIGMSEEQLNRLFKAFSQADTSITRKYGGTGLGLTITKNLCKMMGGNITVDSAAEKGSRFTVILPFKKADKKEQAIRIIPGTLTKVALAVVEDNYTAMEVYKNYLDEFPVPVGYYTNAETFLKEYPEKRYNMIIMDYKLPGKNGIEAWNEIKKISPNSLPKIIMATAYGREQLITEATEAGIDIILMKPVTYSTLFDAIIRSMEGDKYVNKLYSKVKDLPDVRELKDIRILLVEDNEINQQVAIENLQEIGIETDVADNGEIAIEMIKNSEIKYDIVLMDIQMPVMDGITATRELRRLFTPEELPIIALTADVMKDTVQRTLENGMQAHVPKPIDFAFLLETISKILKGKELKINFKKIGKTFNTEEEKRLIACFDELKIETAVERLNGNLQLYKKTLKNFAEKYHHFEGKIQQLFDQSDYSSIKREFHTLKGLSATLGSEVIAKKAKQYEGLAKDDRSEFQQRFASADYKDLITRIERFRKAIESFFSDETEAVSEIPVGMNEEDFRNALGELEQLFEEFDTESEIRLNELKNEFISRDQKELFLLMEKAIETYDFEGAAELLNRFLIG